MAGAGAKLFTSGSVLTADQVNTYLMDQAIMKFASTTARDAAFGGVDEPTLAEGMFAYTTDTNTLWLYNGSSWVNVLGSDIGEQALSNRNVIINGAMQVAQRGTSTASITTSSYNTADRYLTNLVTLGTWTQSVEADAPTGSGFRNSLKMLCTTADASPAASGIIDIRQRLEGQNVQQFLKGTASAKSFALSFWVKSNVTGTYIAELVDSDNTRSVSASYSISASATWEKKTIIFPADTTGAFDNDNGSSLSLILFLGAGTNFTSGTLATTWASITSANRAVGQTNLAAATSNYWQVTGVQLEVGAVATPFEFEDISTTLAKCQRYYWRTTAADAVANAAIGAGQWQNSTTFVSIVNLPTTMRVAPTSFDLSSLGIRKYTGADVAITSPATERVASASFILYGTTAATSTANDGGHLTVSGYLGASAEL
jgi:hypothetical protein